MRGVSIFSLFTLIVFGLASMPGAQTVIKVAHINDPGVAAVFYAIKEGIVKSDKVKLELQAMSIPGVIQALQTKQTDIVQTSVIAFSKGVKRGLKAKIIAVGAIPQTDGYGIFVKSDSPIKKVADLRGKSWGVLALGASNVVHTRIVLEEKYNLRTGPVGGDLKPIQAPPLQLLALLERGNIDATFAFGVGFYRALRNKGFRLLVNAAAEYQGSFGSNPPVAVLVAFTDRIEKNPAAMKEAQRLLFESAKYYLDHRGEVSKAMASKYRANLDYLRWWGTKGQFDPHTLEPKYVKALDKFLQLAHKIGELNYSPNINDLIWKGYWQ